MFWVEIWRISEFLIWFIFSFLGCKIFNIFESACFRNVKLSGCTCTCWSGTLVVICFLRYSPLFHASLFSTLKTQRPWSDCADAHACTYWSRTLLVRCFLGITLCFILIIFFLFCFVFAKVLTGPFFTYVVLWQKPRSTCVDAHYNELSNTLDTPFNLK